MLGQILLTFITVLVGVNLVPTIADSVYDLGNVSGTGNTNLTGASLAIVGLIPLFFVLGIVLTTIYSSMTVMNKMGF